MRWVCVGTPWTVAGFSLTTNYELMRQCAAIGISVTDEWGARPLGFVQAAKIEYRRNVDTVGTLYAGADPRIDSGGAVAF